MKIEYKIMWVDDKPKQMATILKEIEEVLTENYFIPDIKEAFRSYEDFRKVFETSSGEDNETNVFNDCDLLLIDYHLSERDEDDDKTGEALIDKLRKRGIFTEVVFYSDAMSEYRQGKRRELDNVTYADKNEVVRKVEHLVKKAVRQGMNISNLRGYLMDSTAEFDFICKEMATYYFMRLGISDQKKIMQIIERELQSQFELETKKFNQINNKYKNVSGIVKKERENINFSEINDTESMVKILSQALDSVDLVMPTSVKYKILSIILTSANIANAEKIYYVSKDGNENEPYKKSIITPRNKLAHSKLVYGKHCGGERIKIVGSLAECACTCDESCYTEMPNCKDKSFTYKQCEQLRKDIFDYYCMFRKLLNER